MNYPSYLIHYGVKGQLWGKRRYQYEDGSLTPEGRQHYGIGEKEAKKLQRIAIERNKMEKSDYDYSSRHRNSKSNFYKNYRFIRNANKNRGYDKKMLKELNKYDKFRNFDENHKKYDKDFEKLYKKQEKAFDDFYNKNKITKETLNKKLRDIEDEENRLNYSYRQDQAKVIREILGEYSDLKVSDSRTLEDEAVSLLNRKSRTRTSVDHFYY